MDSSVYFIMTDVRKSILGLRAKRSGLRASNQNFSPIKWTQYFDMEENIDTDHGSYHVFCKGDDGPILMCLHGGGYSGLTWALFATEIVKQIQCQVKAIDFRGHGSTTTDNDHDLSLDTLAKDVVDVVDILLKNSSAPIILMGHSMGGAVAVEVAHHISVSGLCVIDVVEGTALDTLSSMQSFLRSRPSHFKDILHAIQWSNKSGQTHNIEAARVSMPGQIINTKTGKLAADECDSVHLYNIELNSSTYPKQVTSPYTLTEVAEEVSDKEDTDTFPTCNAKCSLPLTKETSPLGSPRSVKNDVQYTWRIDLQKTEPFWTGWFKGLSQKFLDVRVPKLLLLANIHGLDTTLTIGQMQGKFQMQVLAGSGHAIHEDQPKDVANIVSGYLVKQKLAEPKPALVQPTTPPR